MIRQHKIPTEIKEQDLDNIAAGGDHDHVDGLLGIEMDVVDTRAHTKTATCYSR